MIDYRDLLHRFIHHVRREEGSTFINMIRSPDDPDWSDPDMVDMLNHIRFSNEEIEELHKLSEAEIK
jgi:hypothetical protein